MIAHRGIHPHAAPEGPVARDDQLVAEILHRVVAAPDGDVVVTYLVEKGVGSLHLEAAAREGGVSLHAHIVERKGRRMEGVARRPHHPVDEVVAPMVKGTRGEAAPQVAALGEERAIERRERHIVGGLHREILVALVGGRLVEELGEGGQMVAPVVAQHQPPSRSRTPGDIHAGIERGRGRRSADDTLPRDAGREGPGAQRDVVLQREVENGARGVDEGLAVALVTHLGRHCRLAALPLPPEPGLGTEHVGAVLVFAGGSAANELEVVVVPLPIHLRCQG